VVRAVRVLLERHGDEVLLYSRHSDEIEEFGAAEKVTFFPQTVYSSKGGGEIADVAYGFQPDVAFVHNVYPLLSPSVYHMLHSLGVPAVQACSRSASRMFGRHHSLPRQRRPSSREGIPGSVGDSKTARMWNFKKLESAVDPKKSGTSFSGDMRTRCGDESLARRF
jgi:hypothetical protein